jgi:predicted HTH domain antitoxin
MKRYTKPIILVMAGIVMLLLSFYSLNALNEAQVLTDNKKILELEAKIELYESKIDSLEKLNEIVE